MFSTGQIAYDISIALGDNKSFGRLQEILPLLLNAISQNKLNMETLKEKIHDKPISILGINQYYVNSVVFEADRPFLNHFSKSLSPQFSTVTGIVSRVLIRDETYYLDGKVLKDSGTAREINRDLPPPPEDVRKRRKMSVIDAPTVSSIPPSPKFANADVDMSKEKFSLTERHQQQQQQPQHKISAVELSKSPFYMKNVLSVEKLTRYELHSLFGVTHEIRRVIEKDGHSNILQGKVLCNLFYEPSTRTSSSFEAAMKKLGGEVILVNNLSSSIQKGESLADTIRTVENYSDVIAIRHPGVGSATEASKYSKVPVINAGDGIGEHPTQAFLDVYTIREELGTVNGLDIVLVGDLKHGRTTHSLVKLLSSYNVRLHYVSPPSLRMPQEVMDKVAQAGIVQKEYSSLDEVIGFADVLYVTRIQKERFDSEEEYLAVKSPFIINTSIMNLAKRNMIVMHPLPRVDEIQPEVDLDPRAAYFRQMKYGLYVRMALLVMVLGKA